MSTLIIAVGGTGQLVLYHFLQFYFLGQLDFPFRAAVVDTDTLNRALKIQRDFLDLLQIGATRGRLFDRVVPSVDFVRPSVPAGNDRVSIALTRKPLEQLPLEHPARAFFDEDALRQEIREGLFAKPALSAVLADDWLHNQALTVEDVNDVVVVGSVVGGTGGGLIVPLLGRLRSDIDRRPQLQVRALLLGQWFRSSPGRIHAGDRQFLSNQIMAVRAVKEVGDRLHSYKTLVVDDVERVERNPDQERQGRSLPWPTSDHHPIWTGARWLCYLATEATHQTAQSFELREIRNDLSEDAPVPLATARNELAKRLSRVGSIVTSDVLSRLTADPFAIRVWGGPLCDAVSGLWRVTAEACKNPQLVKEFPNHLADSTRELWTDLCDTFPAADAGRPSSVAALRDGVKWPTVQTSAIKRGKFGEVTAAARHAGATLLWAGLTA